MRRPATAREYYQALSESEEESSEASVKTDDEDSEPSESSDSEPEMTGFELHKEEAKRKKQERKKDMYDSQLKKVIYSHYAQSQMGKDATATAYNDMSSVDSGYKALSISQQSSR